MFWVSYHNPHDLVISIFIFIQSIQIFVLCYSFTYVFVWFCFRWVTWIQYPSWRWNLIFVSVFSFQTILFSIHSILLRIYTTEILLFWKCKCQYQFSIFISIWLYLREIHFSRQSQLNRILWIEMDCILIGRFKLFYRMGPKWQNL